MTALSGKHIRAIVACGLYAIPLLIVGSCHLSNIYRDADLTVSTLGMWEADEGTYAYNAVNLVRYGNLITPNDLNLVLHCPCLTLIQSCYFRILGISIFSSRIQGIVSFLLALLLLYLLWRKLKLLYPGLVSIYIISFNYMLFAYTRSSMAEAHAGILFILITYILFDKAEQLISYRKALLLGFVSFFATFVKPTMVVLPAAVGLFLLAALLEKKDKQNMAADLKRFRVFIAAFGGLALILFLFLVLPNKTEWNIQQQVNMGPTRSIRYLGFAFLNLLQLIKTLVLDPWNSLPFLLAASSIPILVRNYRNQHIDVFDRLQVWCWCAVLMQVAIIGVNFYQPSRYYTAIIWPIGLIDSIYFHRLVTFFADEKENRFCRVYRYVPLVVGIVAFYISNVPVIIMDLALIICVAALSLLKRQKAAIVLYSAIFVVLPIGSYGTSYSNWIQSSSHSFYEALVDIGNRIPADCIIMGRMASFVALTHPCKAYVGPGALDGKNMSPDFLILNNGHEEMENWFKTNGKAMNYLKYGFDESFKPLQYRIMGNYYSHKNTLVLRVKKSL